MDVVEVVAVVRVAAWHLGVDSTRRVCRGRTGEELHSPRCMARHFAGASLKRDRKHDQSMGCRSIAAFYLYLYISTTGLRDVQNLARYSLSKHSVLLLLVLRGNLLKYCTRIDHWTAVRSTARKLPPLRCKLRQGSHGKINWRRFVSTSLVPRKVFGLAAEEKTTSNGQHRAHTVPDAEHRCPLYEPRELCSVRLVVRYHQPNEADEIREDTKGKH